ncbi:type II toxin-antitoxin system antitoxin SocA domain-containing protein [Sphingorhabdus sp. Alg239-R122]|uniref:Panacea domain-containing protein n=1 Tax=Sphingorhabdus sp. Alg239-R122 TaxID=2305989 RepID=UPI0013DA28EE|nr:type II toxin-antitoxin system antitoxin SocA domain-containing protein [Sphingorhabdus sp. Alg239-R122]
MPYPSLRVANELLSLHGDISPMKLQKLLYYTNGWWLALRGKPLLNENPQVWRYGPVFSILYSTFSRFGHDNIGQPVPAGPFGGEPPALEDNGDDVRAFLEWVWGEHGTKTAGQLSDETHAIGTPWRQIAEQHNFRVPRFTEIPPHLDHAYFSRLAEARGVNPVPLG